MASKKEPSVSFTSLRIIGEKAQKLLQRAREIQTKRAEPEKNMEPLPVEEELPVLTVHLSIRSVVKAAFAILAIILGVFLLYYLRDKIVLLLLAVFVATIIDPGVQALQRFRVPRGVAVLIHYFVALFLFVFLLVSLIPILAEQLQRIALFIGAQAESFLKTPHISFPFLSEDVNVRLTQFLQNGLQNLEIGQLTDALKQASQTLSTTAQGSFAFAYQLAGSVVEFFVSMILILVLAFFMQLEKERILAWLRGFLPWGYRTYVHDKSEAIQWKLSQWIRGQLILCASIGFMVFLALSILRVDYALTLGILAGFTEFIPVVGPLFAAIPAVLIAMTQHGFFWGCVIAAVYYVIQWCENNLLVPLIMRRAVGLSPIAIMFAMLTGISFPWIIHPILGVILAIPLTTIIALFLEDWRAWHNRGVVKEARGHKE